MTKILHPSNELIFKALLTHPDAEPVLLDFISCLLDKTLKKVELKKNELPVASINEKEERFDVNLNAYLLDDNKQIAVGLRSAATEQRYLQVFGMQAKSMEGDNKVNYIENIMNRSIYYLCDLHANQPGQGRIYKDYFPSYQVTLCQFDIFPKLTSFIHKFVLTNAETGKSIDIISSTFVELRKKALSEAKNKNVNTLTSLEKWALFFGYANDAYNGKLLYDLIHSKEEIAIANNILTGISQDDNLWFRYRSCDKFIRDLEINVMATKEAGMEKGMRKGRIQVARKLIHMDQSDELIQEATGFTLAEIERFRK